MSDKFIGWVSWNPGRTPINMGGLINNALRGYSGPIFANDVYSEFFDLEGVVFSKGPLDDNAATTNYFEEELNQATERDYAYVPPVCDTCGLYKERIVDDLYWCGICEGKG